MEMENAIRNQRLREQHNGFSWRAGRHLAALAAEPRARLLEFIPMPYFLPPEGNYLLDLMGGTGWIAERLKPLFSRVTVIEEVPDLAGLQSPSSTTVVANAERDTLERLSLEPFDVIVCHAAFHHTGLRTGISDSTSEVRAARLEVLRLWRSLLAPGGRMLISDVPADCPNEQIRRSEPQLHLISDKARAVLDEAVTTLESFGFSWPSPMPASTLEEHAQAMRFLMEPSPACFFDQFVAHANPCGHNAQFETPSSLIALLGEAGFNNIQYAVVPTPWIFQDLASAVWYVRELFGIGLEPATDSASVAPADAASILHAAETCLGVIRNKDDSVCIGWKLMYVSGDNPV